MFNRDFLSSMVPELVRLWPTLSPQDRIAWDQLAIAVVGRYALAPNYEQGHPEIFPQRISAQEAMSSFFANVIFNPLAQSVKDKPYEERQLTEASAMFNMAVLNGYYAAIVQAELNLKKEEPQKRVVSDELRYLMRLYADHKQQYKLLATYQAAKKSYRSYLDTLADGSELKTAKQEVLDDVKEAFNASADPAQQLVKIELLTQVLTQVGKDEINEQEYTQLKDKVVKYDWGKKLAETMNKHTVLFVTAGLLAAASIVLIGCMPVIGLPLALGIGFGCVMTSGILSRVAFGFFNQYKDKSLEKVVDALQSPVPAA